MKKKIANMHGLAMDTMKVGMTGMVGHSVLGTMSNMPGMPPEAKTTANVAGAGLTLANVGQFGKVGMGVAGSFGGSTKSKQKQHQHHRVVRNILGR